MKKLKLLFCVSSFILDFLSSLKKLSWSERLIDFLICSISWGLPNIMLSIFKIALSFETEFWLQLNVTTRNYFDSKDQLCSSSRFSRITEDFGYWYPPICLLDSHEFLWGFVGVSSNLISALLDIFTTLLFLDSDFDLWFLKITFNTYFFGSLFQDSSSMSNSDSVNCLKNDLLCKLWLEMLSWGCNASLYLSASLSLLSLSWSLYDCT